MVFKTCYSFNRLEVIGLCFINFVLKVFTMETVRLTMTGSIGFSIYIAYFSYHWYNAGRAGRVSDGRVYYMVPRWFYETLSDYGTPEMQVSCSWDETRFLFLKSKQRYQSLSVTIQSTLPVNKWMKQCSHEEIVRNTWSRKSYRALREMSMRWDLGLTL